MGYVLTFKIKQVKVKLKLLRIIKTYRTKFVKKNGYFRKIVEFVKKKFRLNYVTLCDT